MLLSLLILKVINLGKKLIAQELHPIKEGVESLNTLMRTYKQLLTVKLLTGPLFMDKRIPYICLIVDTSSFLGNMTGFKSNVRSIIEQRKLVFGARSTQ